MPALAQAAPIIANPKTVALDVGAHDSARVSARTDGAHLVVSPATTCFSTKGGPGDILRVTAVNSAHGQTMSLSVDVRAQRGGSCEIIFASDKDSAVINVVVKQ